MTAAALLLMLGSCTTALLVPWMGIVIYYVLVVGQVTSFWPSHFGELRFSLYLSLAIIAGLGLATITRQVDYRRLLHTPNLLMFLLVALVNLSSLNSPYEGFVEIKASALSPAEMLSTFNKIVVVYFAAVLLIDTRYKLVVLLSAIAGVLMVYMLWANKVYLTGEFWRFGDNGRLNGPEGLYNDENYLGMLFVLATPLFYYLSVGTTSRVVRYGLWLCIPLSWHALFLTGSRGALLSLCIVCVYIFFRSYSKNASVVLIVALAVAVVDQSGNMLNRVTDTVNAEELQRDLAFIENDDSAEFTDTVIDPRLISWQVGLNIMRDHPVFGVGVGNFMRAFPDYHDSKPHVAHNTFVQFAASCGVAAGLIYLYFLYMRFRTIFNKSDPTKKYTNGLPRDYLEDLLNSLFLGFYSIAFFLDLMILELLYLVLIGGVCKYSLDAVELRRANGSARGGLLESIYR